MGEELGNYFHHTRQELLWTASIWDVHEVLFSSPESVAVLNEENGGLAFKLQTILLEYTVIGVCRLTDPARQKRGNNTTILAFPDLIDAGILAECRKRISIAKKCSTPLRDWRNRKIGHADFDLKKGTAKPLESITRKSVTETIARIHDVLHLLSMHYCDTNLGLIGIGDDDALQLIVSLMESKRMKEIRNNEITPRDFDSLNFRFPEWLHSNDPMARYDLNRIANIPVE